MHPALLDAALHAAVIANQRRRIGLPFSWQGVSLHAAGASAVRARIAPSGLPGASGISIELADGLGLPVLSVARDGCPSGHRAAAAGWDIGGSSAGPDRLFEVVWSPAPSVSAAGTTPSYEVFESVVLEQDPVTASYERTHQALAAVQSWLTERDSGLLVVVTRGAVALPGEDVTDLAGAAVWGLVRSAQTEHPGRIVLVDSDVLP